MGDTSSALTGPQRTRPYRITAFFQKGEIGEGGLGFAIGTKYASEEAAIHKVRQRIAEKWDDQVTRYLICKFAGEACWVTADGEVVRRDLNSLPFGADLWGYAS